MPFHASTIVTLMLVLAWLPGSVSAIQPSTEATASPEATPTQATGIALLLPTEEQVPDGLVIIDDGDRTLSDITDGFSDPTEAASMFVEWGWERNVIRAFHTPNDAAADPDEIDGIYVSIHELGSPEAAAKALDYTVEVHQAGADLEELEHEGFGDNSTVLFGDESYGNEITIYAQQGNVLVRLSASSPEGDPTEEASELVTMMLDNPYFEQQPA